MEIWGEKYGILGIRGAQLYNYEDILLYSTDDKVYFLPATDICREEMSLEATFPLNSDHEEYLTTDSYWAVPLLTLSAVPPLSSPSHRSPQTISPAGPEITKIHLGVWPWQ